MSIAVFRFLQKVFSSCVVKSNFTFSITDSSLYLKVLILWCGLHVWQDTSSSGPISSLIARSPNLTASERLLSSSNRKSSIGHFPATWIHLSRSICCRDISYSAFGSDTLQSSITPFEQFEISDGLLSAIFNNTVFPVVFSICKMHYMWSLNWWLLVSLFH